MLSVTTLVMRSVSVRPSVCSSEILRTLQNLLGATVIKLGHMIGLSNRHTGNEITSYFLSPSNRLGV